MREKGRIFRTGFLHAQARGAGKGTDPGPAGQEEPEAAGGLIRLLPAGGRCGPSR